MKKKPSKKKQKGIAERKTEVKRHKDIPYKAIGLGMVLWLLTTWLFFGRGIAPKVAYEEGDRIPATIEAQVDFSCENVHDTDLAKQQAANNVPLFFKMDTVPRKRAITKIQAVFDRLAQIAAAPDKDRSAKIASLSDLLLGSDVETHALVQAFPSNAIAQTKETILGEIKSVMDTGIMSDETRETFANEASDRVLSISAGTDQPARKETLGKIMSRRQAVSAITKTIGNDTRRDLLNKLLSSVVEDNLSYDAGATEDRTKKAEDAVEPVIAFHPEGSVLVRAGEVVDSQILEVLKKHGEKLQKARDFTEIVSEIAGNGLLLLIGLIATSIILRVGNAKLFRQADKILLMIVLSLFTIGVASLLGFLSFRHSLLSQSLIPYLVPYALAVLLAGILLGSSAAVCLGFWTSFATAIMLDQSFSAFALGMLVTVTAASTARNVHRRSSLFRAGLWICVVKMLYVLVIALLKHQKLPDLASQLAAAILSGVVATVLTLLLIPLFEKLFKITTDITLLELSDMGHPLLQKMAMQAPGTYHHSLMVATLAQNAAEAIGANSLLVRVCAYYHDIGKMAKPEFFTENIQHQENPHDDLSPHMSALVISSHVKEGLTLAKRHKLPQPILDAIEQHHGNGLISFFYHKAKQQAGDGTTTMADLINESDFRYGGAPAVTKEMAILSLADASEAASRSIEKPTPQKISNLLDDIFNMKIRDGQMDFANLTMAEIKVVKQSFIFSLSNMLHGRIPYPKADENKSPKPAAKPSGSDQKAAKAQ